MTRRPRPRRGFTLLELLAVMGIMILLMSMLASVALFARRRAQVQTERFLFTVIGEALDNYKADFGDYPRNMALQYCKTTSYNNPAPPEFRSLAIGLLGPCGDVDAASGTDAYGRPLDANFHVADGANGPGFRTHLMNGVGSGKVWGPYLLPDKFPIQFDAAGQPDILDIWGTPIQYFPRYRQAGNHTPPSPPIYPTPPSTNASTGQTNNILAGPLFGLVGSNTGDDQAMFDSRDGNFNHENGLSIGKPGLDQNVIGASSITFPNCVYALLIRLGDDNCNNFIENAPAPANNAASSYNLNPEVLRWDGPYVLISAGPQGVFDDLTQDPFYVSSGSVNEQDWTKDIQESTNVYNWERHW